MTASNPTPNDLDSSQLSHVDHEGDCHMVDVGNKAVTQRKAIASSICEMQASTHQAIVDHQFDKGPVLQTARLAGIAASKRTDELIPLCHQIPLDSLQVDFEWLNETQLQITCTAKATARTGVEMEAMVAASMAALTVYDMCKAVDREMRVGPVQLLYKTGGKTGTYQRDVKQ